MPLPSTLTPIATTTFSSTTANTTFSNIPQTYTDLVLVISLTNSAGTPGQINMIYNGDTGSNYSETLLSGNGTTASSGRRSNVTKLDTGYQGSASQGTNIAHIMNYTNGSVYKTSISRGNSNEVSTNVGLWRSTSSITSITLTPQAVGFSSGTTITLFGVKAAS